MQRIPVGAMVRVIQLPPFIKTAAPMPVLRSNTLIAVGELGQVNEQRPAGYYSVRFTNGMFLIDQQYLEVAPDPQP